MSSCSRAARPASLSLGVFSILSLGLAACDGAPSAMPARSHVAGQDIPAAGRDYQEGGIQQAAYSPEARPASSAAKPDLDADTPRYHGKPVWAANKTHSGEENADYQFKKNGQDIGAASLDDFIAKVHGFVDHPPKGAETLTRANGDVLIYDPASNLFAVATKDGAPRTLFKPRDGAAYWAQQKTEADQPYGSSRGSASTARSASRSDDNG